MFDAHLGQGKKIRRLEIWLEYVKSLQWSHAQP